jgi:hypothetical protein
MVAIYDDRRRSILEEAELLRNISHRDQPRVGEVADEVFFRLPDIDKRKFLTGVDSPLYFGRRNFEW